MIDVIKQTPKIYSGLNEYDEDDEKMLEKMKNFIRLLKRNLTELKEKN